MPRGAQRLLLGVALCCLLLGTAEPLAAQCGVYNTIFPLPYALKEAVYPFTIPFSNLVQMTRWDGEPGACGPGGCRGRACPGTECARLCCPIGPEGRLWGRADYLLWWTPGARVPALVVTGPNDGSVPDQTLFGDRAYNDDTRHQYRFHLGYWLGDCRRWAIQSDWLDLGQNTTEYAASSAEFPILARPFRDVLRDQDSVQLIGFPNFAEGSVNARMTESFHSVGVHLRRNLLCHATAGGSGCEGDGGRLDLIGGYRYYKLQDSVTIWDDITLIQGQGGHQAGTRFNSYDAFRARNEFHGAELGLIAQRYRGRWSVEAAARLAIGGSREVVTIDGQTTITVPNQAPVTHTGGLLALDDTNIGTHRNNSVAVIPHFNVELGYQLTTRTRVYMGYDFLLWTRVKRAGDHIDTQVNTSYMPPPSPTGPAVPAFAANSADFWAQGFNLGCELRF